jgi:hypothetical protein
MDKVGAEYPPKAPASSSNVRDDANENKHAEDEKAGNGAELDDSSPHVIVSGKRDRKRTKIFEVSSQAVSRSRRLERKKGNGVALGQIPNVSFLLNNAKGRDDELILLHRLVLNSAGVATKRKSNIREFSGYAFDSDKDRDRIKQKLSKEPIALIRRVAQLLDLPNVSVTKPALIDAVTAFLEDPRPGVDRIDLAAKAQKRKEERAWKRERKLLGTDRPSKSTGRKAKRKKNKDTDSESGTDDEVEADETILSRVAAGSGVKRKETPIGQEAISKKKSQTAVKPGNSDEDDGEEPDSSNDDEADSSDAAEHVVAKEDKSHDTSRNIDNKDENEDKADRYRDKTAVMAKNTEEENSNDEEEFCDNDDSPDESEPVRKRVKKSMPKEDEHVEKKVQTKPGRKTEPKNEKIALSKRGSKVLKSKQNDGIDDEEEEPGQGMPSKKDLDDAVSKLLATGNVENLTVRSVRTSLETQFRCSLQSRMAFLRKAVAEKLK